MKPTKETKPVKSAAQAPGHVACVDPATQAPLGSVPVDSPDEVHAAVARAKSAARAWAKTSFAERRRVLSAILAYTVDHKEEICELVQRASGKTRENALMGEIWTVLEKLTWTIKNGERHLTPETVSSGLFMHKRAQLELHPLGVIGAILPWNYPLQNILNPLIPALMAGNAVVIKPSEWVAWSADRIADIASRMKGFKTRTYTEKVYLHYRHTGTAQQSLLMAKFRDGGKDYSVGTSPVWEVFRTIYQMTKRPFVVGSLMTACGYIWATVKRVERPVPQDGVVPGETLSPTQPFPTKPPPLHPTELTAENAFGFTFWDRAACREQIASLRSDGIFTPPSLQGSVSYPGMAGGANWGSVAIDPQRKLLLVNQQRTAVKIRLVPRADFEKQFPYGVPLFGYEPQGGTPYALERVPPERAGPER